MVVVVLIPQLDRREDVVVAASRSRVPVADFESSDQQPEVSKCLEQSVSSQHHLENV